jgi:uncharacterized protein YecE (DUF72 family)
MGEIRIGISDWTYPLWRGRFYPRDGHNTASSNTPARQVSSIEINGSFYSRFSALRATAPGMKRCRKGFVFSIKGSLSAKGAGWLADAESQPPR